MEKYRVHMRDKDTGKVEDDCIDEIFLIRKRKPMSMLALYEAVPQKKQKY